jgi:Flp pilus assembly protein TadD/O-antigen ligase
LAGIFILAALAGIPLAVNTASYNIVYIKEIIFSICAFMLGYVLLFQKDARIKKAALLPAGYIAYAMVSAAFSRYPYASFDPLCMYAALFIFFLAVANIRGINNGYLRNMILITSIPALVIGLFQAFFPGVMKGFMVFGERVPATFGNPNFFAAYLVAILPVAFWRTLYGLGMRKFFNLVLSAAIIFLIFRTGSKAGLLAVAAEFCMLVTAILRQRNVRLSTRMIILSVIAVFMFAGGAKIMGVPLGKLADISQWTKNDSVFFRVNTWKGTASMVKANPLTGAGPGAYYLAYPPFRPEAIMKWADKHEYETTYPENMFVQAAAETGIPGLLILLAMTVFMFMHFSREEKEETDFKLGFTGLMVINLFGVDSNFVTSSMFFALYAGIFMKDYEGASFKIKGLLKTVLIALLAVIVVGIIVFQFRRNSSDTYLIGAVYSSRDRNFGRAVPLYQSSLEMDGNNLVARYFLANSYYDSDPRQNAEKALAAYNELEKLAPYYTLLPYRKAKILADTGRYDEAVAEYKKMLALDPYYMPALSELAYIYYEAKNDPAGAEALLMDAVKRRPDDPSFYNNLGNIYFVLKQYDRAVGYYKKAIELKEDKDYYYNLGCVYLALEKVNDARENLLKAKQLDTSGDTKITRMLGVLELYGKKKKR